MFATDFGLGTLISNASESFGSGSMRKRADARFQAGQRETMRNELPREMISKVEAAKAAGLHPSVVFGGGGGVSSSPIISSASPPAPQANFQFGKQVDPDIARYNSARADLAELDVQAARNRLASQPGNSGGAILDESSDMSSQTGRFQLKPSEVATSALRFPNLTAGPDAPGQSRFTVLDITGNPVSVILPSKDSSEPLEGMGELWKAILGLPMGLKASRQVFLPDHLIDRMDREYKSPWGGDSSSTFDLLEAIRRFAAPDSRRRSQGRMFPR